MPESRRAWPSFLPSRSSLVSAQPEWRPAFYRTANGAEADLVLTRGRTRVAVECKASAAPTVSRGFHRTLDDLGADEGWLIAPVRERYPLAGGIQVAPLEAFLQAREPARSSDF
jgi:hypothetical protein